MEADFIEETDKFLKECGRTAYDIAKEAGISPVLLNSYMSERMAKRSRVENMRLKIFVRLWPIVEKWKQEEELINEQENVERKVLENLKLKYGILFAGGSLLCSASSLSPIILSFFGIQFNIWWLFISFFLFFVGVGLILLALIKAKQN